MPDEPKEKGPSILGIAGLIKTAADTKAMAKKSYACSLESLDTLKKMEAIMRKQLEAVLLIQAILIDIKPDIPPHSVRN